jgi:alkanesulfonate monooxygenase SsuD/methylene tetrahydromethanopterin reductase-like flavin-dependent oxidoreductase (luciferase family)
MRIGVNVPAMLRGTGRDHVLAWARRIDDGPFSSLGMGERLNYPGWDALITLGAAAAITERVRLVSAILILPLHREVLAAKQAATLDVLSAGRLTLGVGIGGRREDLRSAEMSASDRGHRVGEQVARMREVWRGSPASGCGHVIGPRPVQPDGPPIVAGSSSSAGVRAAARWADGLFPWSFDTDPRSVARLYAEAERARAEHGSSRRLIRLAGWYFALGPTATADMDRFLSDYHGDRRHPHGPAAAATRCTSADGLRAALRAFADIGTEEVILSPVSGDPEQVDRLADLVA